MKGLFIFRRDLRTEDNTALHELLKTCDKVFCLFVLDNRQINPKQNPYMAYNSFLFMLQGLRELKDKIKLTIEAGMPHKIIEQIYKNNKFDIVAFNRDYTPFSIQRDKEIAQTCKNLAVKLETYDDYCLNSPDSIKPYKVFTPYFNYAKKKRVREIENYAVSKIDSLRVKSINVDSLIKQVTQKLSDQQKRLIQHGGRKLAVQTLKKFVSERCSKYTKNRDQLSFETSRLSPYIKFGNVSIREVYWACNSPTFRKELYWRDFYMQIGYHFPQVFGKNFKGHIKWSSGDRAQRLFKAWCEGETGYDIVDACMNQLNQSGYMHNRGRMIVASFLTKILHVDWRLGERYFATRLTDYDVFSNNGGWQWSAGTGADAQPYFRIFNPFTQAEKFDADESYRDRWLGSDWKTRYAKMKKIVDYQEERVKALELYKN